MHGYQEKLCIIQVHCLTRFRQLKGLSPADIEIMLEALVLTMKLQKRQKIWKLLI